MREHECYASEKWMGDRVYRVVIMGDYVLFLPPLREASLDVRNSQFSIHFSMQKKAPSLRRKVNRKPNFLSVWRGLPLYDDSICPISHSLFIQKKVLFLHLLKKVLRVTREQLTLSDSDDDFEHEWFTRASLAPIIIFARKSQFSSLVAQCTNLCKFPCCYLKVL